MPGGKKKRKTNRPRQDKSSGRLYPFRAGMPAKDSITGVEEFRKAGKVYRIIHTNEVDEYEDTKPAKPKS
jgi:hypothetical protein